MTSIREALASAVFDASHRNGDWPRAADIESVEFDKFGTQIEVKYRDDEDDPRFATIPSASILTAMLQKMIEDEHDE